MKLVYPMLLACLMVPVSQATVFINEIHYDNDGTDVSEAIEIAGSAGTDLSNMTLVLYNGNGGGTYGSISLSGVISDQQNGFGVLSFAAPSSGLQNGSPDGVALVDAAGQVVQFLSYEGTITAVGGPADGLTSTDIGVAESSTSPVGTSLQLTGSGSNYADFSWVVSADDSFGDINAGQGFAADGSGGDSGSGNTDIISGTVCTNCPDLEKIKLAAEFDASAYYAPVQTELELSAPLSAIRTALNSVISAEAKTLSYSEVWTALTYTDEDPANSNNVILWYTGRTQAKSTNGSGTASSNPDNWNREHSWPNSHGFASQSFEAYTDIHHLRATDISVNGSRGNLDFDNSDAPLAESPINRIDGDSFEPREQIKGDVARMMLYLDVRYEGSGSDSTPDLVLVNRITSVGEPNLGKLCTLLAWHAADPVDADEQRRNDRIYELQGNRNPFIDHPEWVSTLYPTDSCDTSGGDTGGEDNGGGDSGGDNGGDAGGDTGTGEATLVFINEIHYDNASTDAGEAIEIAGLAGTDLTGMSLVLYNGSSSQLNVYGNIALSGVIANQQAGFGTLSFAVTGIQNGSPDGVALVDAEGQVIQFLSYEGSFTAADGPATGMTSIDIGVAETSSTPMGQSLQLVGSGFRYQDFSWQAPSIDSFGAVNEGQSFVAPAPFINEIHYDNAGADTDEAVEIAGLAGTDLSGMSLVLYNGSSSQLKMYATIALSGVIDNQQGGFGTLSFATPGIQNGAPDGLALIDTDNSVIQFLSYEGSFTAVDGPAAGMTSSDIGVSESGNEAAGNSLQLAGNGVQYSDFSWQAPASSTFAAVNIAQSFGAGNGDNGNGNLELGSCSDVATFISAIQGNAAVSPLLGETHVVEAVVSAAFPAIGGFFVQEEVPDYDADFSTSEGLFVYYSGSLPDVGAVVRILGTVEEFRDKTQLSVQEAPLVCGSADVQPTPFSLPFSSAEMAESLEGMLVSTANELVVSDNYNLGKFGEVTLSLGRIYNPTNLYVPGSAEAQQLAEQNALNRIILDDGMNGSNPAQVIYPTGGLSAANTLRSGDTVAALTGVMDYSFSNYRILPTVAPNFVSTNPRTDEPLLALGNLKVASLNVLNLFTSLNPTNDRNGPRGANSAEELERQLAKTIAAIIAIDADIVGLMEIENNGSGTGSALLTLVNGLNAVAGEGTYALIDTGAKVGTDQITTALIYKPAKVAPSAVVNINNDVIFNRPPIAQTFALRENGETVTVVVNHFKSKGCGSASGADADQQDGQGCYNQRRVEQANALVNWLATDAQLAAQSRKLIIGDLNAYAKEAPVAAIEAAGFTNLLAHFRGAEAYSYSFNGELGYLDHALASADLLDVAVDANDWHINADEPIVLDYNTEDKTLEQQQSFYAPDPYRMSDHDPVVMSFQIDKPRVLGDFDEDGDVDARDMSGLLKAILTKQDIDPSFDINGDGVINTLDAKALKSLCTRKGCAVK